MIPRSSPHRRFRSPVFPSALAVCLFWLAACIDRSNPFDPANAGPKAAADQRTANKTALDSLADAESGFSADLAAFAALFAADSTENAARSGFNADARAQNGAVDASNDIIRLENDRVADPDSLRHQGGFEYLDTLKTYGPYPNFQQRRSDLRIRAGEVSRFISGVNERNVPLVVYNSAFIDSVLRPFVRDSLAFARMRGRIDSGIAAVGDTNAAVRVYNAGRASDNAVVALYNDSIDFLKQARNKNLIAGSDSLVGTAFVAKPGDSLLLAPGVFEVDLRFTNSGTPDSPIVVRGSPGRRSVLKPSVDKSTGQISGSTIILPNRAYIRFEDIVFRGGFVSGAKLESGSRNISFRRCQFDSSGQWGLEIINSEAEMVDCRVIANGLGGIRIQGDEAADYRIRLANNLIAGNGGHGIEAVTPLGEVSNCTISGNAGDGIRVNAPKRAFTVSNSIISSNRGIGIFREPDNGFQEVFVVKECDVWGNVHADWDLTNMDAARADNLKRSNLNVEPLFIDSASFNYGLVPGSVLAGYENQPLPIIIGYRP